MLLQLWRPTAVRAMPLADAHNWSYKINQSRTPQRPDVDAKHGDLSELVRPTNSPSFLHWISGFSFLSSVQGNTGRLLQLAAIVAFLTVIFARTPDAAEFDLSVAA